MFEQEFYLVFYMGSLYFLEVSCAAGEVFWNFKIPEVSCAAGEWFWNFKIPEMGCDACEVLEF